MVRATLHVSPTKVPQRSQVGLVALALLVFAREEHVLLREHERVLYGRPDGE